MNILAIETSCDDTCASVVTDGHQIKSNIISSQTQFHEKYGGVVPEIASRKHLNVIEQVIDESLIKAGIELSDIDLFAATAYHGLSGSLLVGLMAAKTLAFTLQKPFLPINHIEGHIYANIIEHQDIRFPFLCLTVSGGHSILLLIHDHHQYEVLGKTVDDAAGEAFDKIAQILGLGFPGGPVIDKLSKSGDSTAYLLPRPMIKKDNYMFSFSGLKTAMLNLIINLKNKNVAYRIEDVCASFQQALVDVLVQKTIKATLNYKLKLITLSGGVAANSLLRSQMIAEAEKHNIQVIIPPLAYCMDNAAMIGCLAYYRYVHGFRSDLNVNAIANTLL